MQLLDNNSQQFNSPEEEVAHLRYENLRLQADKALLEVRVRQLESFLKWENKLFAIPSEDMSDAHKVIARTLPTIVKKARERTLVDDARDDGLVQVYRAEFSKATGKSEDRVGSALKDMAENNMIKRQFKRDFRNGQPDNAIFIDITQELLQAEVKSAERRNTGNGQKNFVCKACHSLNTVVERVYRVSCRDCGEVTYLSPLKKEDKAFIIDNETAENFEEWYGKVDTTVVEEEPEKVIVPTEIAVPIVIAEKLLPIDAATTDVHRVCYQHPYERQFVNNFGKAVCMDCRLLGRG